MFLRRRSAPVRVELHPALRRPIGLERLARLATEQRQRPGVRRRGRGAAEVRQEEAGVDAAANLVAGRIARDAQGAGLQRRSG